MSENNPEPEPIDQSLSALEADLAGIAPTLVRFSRDAVLYQSGQRTAERNYRRSVRRWQGACGMLVSLMLIQSVWVWQLPGNQNSPQIAVPEEPSATDPASPHSADLLVDDSNDATPPVSPEAVPDDTAPEPNSAVASRERGIIDAWLQFSPNENRSWPTSSEPGLRSGSALSDLDAPSGFTPRRTLADDSSPVTLFSLPGSRMVQ